MFLMCISDNIMIDKNNNIYAAYKIPKFSYRNQSKQNKLGTVQRMVNFLHSFTGKGHFISLTSESKPGIPTKEDNVFKAEWIKLHEGTQKLLRETRPWQRDLYLLLQIKKQGIIEKINSNPQDFKTIAIETSNAFLRSLLKTTEEQFLSDDSIPEDILLEGYNLEKRLFLNVSSSLGAQRCTYEEIELLNRKGLYRGIPGEPTPFLRNKKVINKAIAMELSEGCKISNKISHIEIMYPGKNDISYQAFFALVDCPEDILPVRDEWLSWIDELNFPVDVSMHFEVESPHTAQQRLSTKKKIVEDQINESGADATRKVLNASEKAFELADKLNKGMPLVKASTIFSVSSTNKNDLEAYCSSLSQVYKPRGFLITRSPGDQYKLFLDFMPGSPMINTWSIPMDPLYLSSSAIHGSSQVGDDLKGFLIGKTAGKIEELTRDKTGGQPVFYEPARPMAELNRSGAILISGTLGSGKSVLKKYIMYLVMLLGGRVFSIDPKGEDWVFSLIPELKDEVRVIDFSPGSGTKINPMLLSLDKSRARAMALDFLGVLLNTSKNEARGLVVSEAVENAYIQNKASLNGLIEMLSIYQEQETDAEQAAEAKKCIALLKSANKSPWGSILFGENTIGISDHKMIIASLAGLPLPQKGAVNYTENERISLSLMLLAISLGKEVLMHSPVDMLKLLPVDEAWAPLSVEQGKALINEVIRMGRWQLIIPLIATQNTKDVSDEEFRNNFGIVFTLRAEDDREIEDALNMLGMDITQENIQRFRKFTSGIGYMKDIEGRVGLIKILPVPEYLLEIFNTKPTERKARNYEAG